MFEPLLSCPSQEYSGGLSLAPAGFPDGHRGMFAALIMIDVTEVTLQVVLFAQIALHLTTDAAKHFSRTGFSRSVPLLTTSTLSHGMKSQFF